MTSMAERFDRATRAMHSTRLSGGHISDALLDDFVEIVLGRATVEEVVRRLRKEYRVED